jgi:hypothetical protein
MTQALKPVGHAILSPSANDRTTACPGSVALCKGMPDDSSTFADDGSATHEFAADCLSHKLDASDILDKTIRINGKPYTMDVDRAERVQYYINHIRAFGGELYVEQRMDIEEITTEKGAHGTTDALVLLPGEIIIADLKDGMGRVDAPNNKQLAAYAKAALNRFDFLGIDRVRLVIVQPKLDHISEWSLSATELDAFIDAMRPKFIRALELYNGAEIQDGDLVPGDTQCKYCKAKATCPALAQHVQDTIGSMFEPANDIVVVTKKVPDLMPDHLAAAMTAVDLIEDWCDAVRKEAYARMNNGIPVPGFKLVQGRRGARAWRSKDEAEATLKTMRLKVEEMYDLSLISPTTAEKLAKASVIGPRQWPKLQDLITQPDGKPAIAPESDPKPAIQVAPRADVFNDLILA